MKDYPITRRHALLSLPALATASTVFAQSSGPFIPVRKLNHVSLYVSDLKRSLEFYQGLFGMPIHAHQGTTVSLQIGSGPQNLGLTEIRPNSKLAISHFCLTTERFNVDRILKILADHGVTRSDPPSRVVSSPSARERCAKDCDVKMRVAPSKERRSCISPILMGSFSSSRIRATVAGRSETPLAFNTLRA